MEMGKIKKVLIAITIGVAISTSLCLSNKGFYSYGSETGYLSDDTMLVSKDGHDLYYACEGEVVTVRQVVDKDVSFVEIENNIGYIDSKYIQDQDKVNIPSLCTGNGVNKGVIDAVNEELLIVPEGLRNSFANSSWSIIVTNDDLNEKYYNNIYDSVSGSTSYKEKVIYISNSLEAAKSATLHEFGHWLDWLYDFPSQDNNFLNIYNKEEGNFYTAFNLSIHWDEREFFAEGFECFFTDRMKLKKECPELYEYMSTILQDLS